MLSLSGDISPIDLFYHLFLVIFKLHCFSFGSMAVGHQDISLSRIDLGLCKSIRMEWTISQIVDSSETSCNYVRFGPRCVLMGRGMHYVAVVFDGHFQHYSSRWWYASGSYPQSQCILLGSLSVDHPVCRPLAIGRSCAGVDAPGPFISACFLDEVMFILFFHSAMISVAFFVFHSVVQRGQPLI